MTMLVANDDSFYDNEGDDDIFSFKQIEKERAELNLAKKKAEALAIQKGEEAEAAKMQAGTRVFKKLLAVAASVVEQHLYGREWSYCKRLTFMLQLKLSRRGR